MTPAERIALIRARAEKATKGPWGVFMGDIYTLVRHPTVDDAPLDFYTDSQAVVLNYPSECDKPGVQRDEDGDFIANAREDVPFLLAELDRAREALTLITEPTGLVDPAELVRLRAIARAALGGE